MWVHSLWSLVPGEVNELVQYISDGVLSDNSEHQDIPGGLLLRQRDTVVEVPTDGDWIRTPGAAETTELVGLYVLTPMEYGLQSTGGRSLVGIVSARPASNHALLERARMVISKYANYTAESIIPILPALSKRALRDLNGLTVYEARTERDDREVSVTYFHPDAPDVLDEWPDDATEFAAVTMSWGNHLLTVFADGQVWLQGVAPEEVPSAIGTVGANLWGRDRIAETVY